MRAAIATLGIWFTPKCEQDTMFVPSMYGLFPTQALGCMEAGEPSSVQTGGEGPKQGRRKSSLYRGVTKHKRSGRFEAHLWIRDLHRQVPPPPPTFPSGL